MGIRQRHNLSEGFGGHIGGILAAVQPQAQTFEQPTMVLAEQAMERLLAGILVCRESRKHSGWCPY